MNWLSWQPDTQIWQPLASMSSDLNVQAMLESEIGGERPMTPGSFSDFDHPLSGEEVAGGGRPRRRKEKSAAEEESDKADDKSTINAAKPPIVVPPMYNSSRVWTTLVIFIMQLLQTSRWFRRRRAVRFDRANRAFGAVESNCPLSSKSSRSLQKLHDKGDEGVHTLDGTEYNAWTYPRVRTSSS